MRENGKIILQKYTILGNLCYNRATFISIKKLQRQGVCTMFKVFIDGQEGTTGLRLAERLARRSDIKLLSIDSALRKNTQARLEKISQADVAFLCLPDAASKEIVEAAKDGPFLSKDDFRQRTKVSKTVVDLMDDLKLLGDLPESNQISLFDFAI